MPGALQRGAHCNRLKTGLPIRADDSKRDRTFPLLPHGVLTVFSDPHSGLLLNKNGPTADCSAAGATIRGARGLGVPSVDSVFVLGFDYRNGTHCGAGSPRFNVAARSGSNSRTFHFIGGCANGVATPAPQDPTEWTRVRFANINGRTISSGTGIAPGGGSGRADDD